MREVELPQHLKPPIWCTFAPPEEWYPVLGDKRYSGMICQWILYKLLSYTVVYAGVMGVTGWILGSAPWWAWIGGWMAVGAALGRDILPNLRYHHMMDLEELTHAKVKGLIFWPFQYLRLWGIYWINSVF